MEGIRPATSFLRLLSDRLGEAQFTLIDIGCSGGIDEIWRVFGTRLRALGFDPNLEEVERLNAAGKSQPGVEYIAAFVGPPHDDPAMARMRTRDFWARNPWGRLSVARTLEIRAAEIAKSNSVEKQRLNQWRTVPLADASQPLVLAEFLRDRAIRDVDFVKIDVDGADLVILRSLERVLQDTQVLGLGIEVNFFGSDDADLNTFHNVDRFMKRAGFELFDLSMRRYSASALPAPIPTSPQRRAPGDASCRAMRSTFVTSRLLSTGISREPLPPHKLAKLAAIFAVFGLPDCAAEVLVRCRSELATILDVDRALDSLVEHCTSPRASPRPATKPT